jgi:hypothetical protein
MQFTFTSAEPKDNLVMLKNIIEVLLAREPGKPANETPQSAIKADVLAPTTTAAGPGSTAHVPVEPKATKATKPKANGADKPAPVPTLDEIRLVLMGKSKDGKEEQGKALLGEFGCVKLSQIPEDRRVEFMARAQAL